MKKTKILIFQKRSRQHIFTLEPNEVKHALYYTYLGLRINSKGTVNMAGNELRDKARRALLAIKDIPVRIGL